MDDYDSFIDEASNVLELIENGENVENLTKKLVRHAELVDPSTWPTTSADPIILSQILANLSTFQSSSSDKPNPRRRSKPINLLENYVRLSDENVITDTGKSAIFKPISILIILIIFLFSYYYFTLPPKCPRPIW
ncbi:unnamed protein product [Caenorhabditis angaria]|uniref:Uncharacterized protein n=1 Tax=Caenorhabditis angaria TaxID=860376 RepID=A0A9P1MVL9_9PELO|nr:unnamed protein product [Caenorhabditis angaria]